MRKREHRELYLSESSRFGRYTTESAHCEEAKRRSDSGAKKTKKNSLRFAFEEDTRSRFDRVLRFFHFTSTTKGEKKKNFIAESALAYSLVLYTHKKEEETQTCRASDD